MFLVDTDRRAASSATTRSRRPSPPSSPYGEWLHAGLVHLDDLPRARLPHAAARLGGDAPADVRLHDRGAEGPARADGQDRLRADRVDGHRHAGRRAVGSVAPAVRLLPAALRAGHQPAARRHPRGAGHLAGRHHRARGQPPRAGAGVVPAGRAAATRSSPTTSWPSSSTSTTTATCRASSPSPSTGCSRVAEGGDGLRRALDDVRGQGERGHRSDGAKVIILTDRHSNAELAPIPSLLLTAAVHHHLIREKTRTKVGLVVESGDAREVHHMALLLGLRRRRHQPVPRLRDHRRHDRPGRAHRASPSARRCATTSRRAPRAC